MLQIAEQVGQISIESTFNKGFAQVFEDLFNLARVVAAGEQLIDQLRMERRFEPPRVCRRLQILMD